MLILHSAVYTISHVFFWGGGGDKTPKIWRKFHRKFCQNFVKISWAQNFIKTTTLTTAQNPYLHYGWPTTCDHYLHYGWHKAHTLISFLT